MFRLNTGNYFFVGIVKKPQTTERNTDIPNNVSRNVGNFTFGHVRSAEVQIRLRILVVRSKSLPGAFWIAGDAISFVRTK